MYGCVNGTQQGRSPVVLRSVRRRDTANSHNWRQRPHRLPDVAFLFKTMGVPIVTRITTTIITTTVTTTTTTPSRTVTTRTPILTPTPMATPVCNLMEGSECTSVGRKKRGNCTIR
jgi:hypothetical protein